MYVNVAVLKETQPRERRVALVPSDVDRNGSTTFSGG
jgi:alanine dehydrogenase